MILFIFSSEFGDREDCSIFYAKYLVVDPSAVGEAQTIKEVHDILKWTSPTVVGKVDDDVRELIDEPQRIVDLLANRGIKAWIPRTQEVVEH